MHDIPGQSAEHIRLRAVDILETVEDAFLVLDRDFRILFANRKASEINRKPATEFLGRTHWEEWPASVGTEVERQYRHVMESRTAAHFEHRYVGDKHDVWLEIDAYPASDGSGGMYICYRDITRRKAADARLLQSEERYRRLLDTSLEGALFVDASDWITYANPRMAAMLGYDISELIDASLFSILFPEDVPEAKAKRALRAMGVQYQYETRLRHRSGSAVWVINSISVVRVDGKYIGTFSMVTDITDRKLSETALRKSQEDLQFAVSAAKLGTFYCEWPLDKIIWNDTCKEHFFLTPDAEVDLELFYSLLHPQDRERTRIAVDKAMSERTDYNVEYRTMANDGRTRWINAVGRGYFDESGTPVRFDGITIDITERKRVELLLRQQSLAFESMFDALIITDLDGRILQTNAAFTLNSGYTKEEAIGQPISMLHLPEEKDILTEMVTDIIRRGEPWSGEINFVRKDGSRGICESSVVPLRDGNGVICGMIGANRDITAVKQSELLTLQASERQRQFLRDVLASVTDGKLMLCDKEDDLPTQLKLAWPAVELDRHAGLSEIRHQALEAGTDCGFTGERIQDLTTAVGEAAMNAVVHAGGGRGIVTADPKNGVVQIRIDDSGQGIAIEDLPKAALSRGYSTRDSLGHGFKMMLETADRVYLLTGTSGTTVSIEATRH